MDHLAVCDMMRGSPSFLLSILYCIIEMLWYAGCKQYISHTCNLHISVNAGCSIISSSLNRSAWRCPNGLLSLKYQSYKYIWYTIEWLHGTASQWSKVLKKKLCIQLIISQTTRWSIWCTRYHWMGPFKQYTKIRNAEDTLFDSCMSQLSNDIRYSRGSLVVPSLYHKQLDGPFNALEIIKGAALTDVLRLQI